MAKRKHRPDPFADYVEWAQHRYDPGHYLGGTLEPHLRKASLGPRARRLSGSFLGLSALMGAVLTVGVAQWSESSRWEVLAYAAFTILLGTAAVRMYWSARR